MLFAKKMMVAGPEVASVNGEFEMAKEHQEKTLKRHIIAKTGSMRKSFNKDVRSPVSVIEQHGNPFRQETTDLVIHDTGDIISSPVIRSVQNVYTVVKEALESFG
jgi:hypothetical protein